MPVPSERFATVANLIEIAGGIKSSYEPKDSSIVRDASYVHTDENYTSTDKAKLAGIVSISNTEIDTIVSS